MKDVKGVWNEFIVTAEAERVLKNYDVQNKLKLPETEQKVLEAYMAAHIAASWGENLRSSADDPINTLISKIPVIGGLTRSDKSKDEKYKELAKKLTNEADQSISDEKQRQQIQRFAQLLAQAHLGAVDDEIKDPYQRVEKALNQIKSERQLPA